MVQFCSQLEAMQNIKEQLEQRTRLIEANIQRQQDELRQIQEELQRVQGQSLQVSWSLRNVWANPERPVPPGRPATALFVFRLLCLLPGQMFCSSKSQRGSHTALLVSDVPAEGSWRSKPELSSDVCGERGAAGGNARHARPGGVHGASTEQHTAATSCSTPVPATNAAEGEEHSPRAG